MVTSRGSFVFSDVKNIRNFFTDRGEGFGIDYILDNFFPKEKKLIFLSGKVFTENGLEEIIEEYFIGSPSIVVYNDYDISYGRADKITETEAVFLRVKKTNSEGGDFLFFLPKEIEELESGRYRFAGIGI